MKIKLYIIIALCTLHIASAHAWNFFGYNINFNYAPLAQAWSVLRSYFSTPRTQPTAVDTARRIAAMQAKSANQAQTPLKVAATYGQNVSLPAPYVQRLDIDLSKDDPDRIKAFLTDPNNIDPLIRLIHRAYGKININNFKVLLTNKHIAQLMITQYKEWIRGFLNESKASDARAIAQLLLQPATEQFETLIGSREGLSLLIAIAHNLKSAPDELVQKSIDNIDRLVTSGSGIIFLNSLIAAEAPLKFFEQFSQFAQQHFQQLIEYPEGISFLAILIKRSSLAERLLYPLIIEHFKTLIKSTAGLDLLKATLIAQPFSSRIFFLDHFAILAQSNDKTDLLRAALSTAPDEAFISLASQHISALAKTENGVELLDDILNMYPTKELIASLVEQVGEFPSSHKGMLFLKRLMRLYPEQFKQAVLTKLAPSLFYPFNDLKNPPLTQTKQHLIANFFSKFDQLKRGGKIDYECCPELQAMTKRVIDLEAQEQAKGRYTFVHAYAWPHHFYREIYTDLWKIVHKEPLASYIFTRFAQLPQAPWMAWDNFVHLREQEKIRQKLVEQGASSYETEKTYKYNMLYMNYALFANEHLGENTAAYIKNSWSVTNISFDPKELIEGFEFAHYLAPADITNIILELKELKQSHAQLSKYGGGILLSFTPELMRQTVYPSKPYGFKHSVVIIDKAGRHTLTTDPKLILDTLRAAPETLRDSDDFEFVCILSSDLALIPNNGLDIYEFNAADPVKLAAWRAKKDKLMQDIKDRINQMKKESAMRRATSIGKHIAPKSQTSAVEQTQQITPKL